MRLTTLTSMKRCQRCSNTLTRLRDMNLWLKRSCRPKRDLSRTVYLLRDKKRSLSTMMQFQALSLTEPRQRSLIFWQLSNMFMSSKWSENQKCGSRECPGWVPTWQCHLFISRASRMMHSNRLWQTRFKSTNKKPNCKKKSTSLKRNKTTSVKLHLQTMSHLKWRLGSGLKSRPRHS